MQFSGIRLIEAMRLLPQGISLAKYAKMVDVKELVKGRMPWPAFTNLEFLLQKTLPRDLASWNDDLSGEASKLSLAEINAIVDQYDSCNFENNRQGMGVYCQGDVGLLLRCILRHGEINYSITDEHLFDCQKITLASYSWYSSQMYLLTQKSIGFFAVNHALIYSILKLGTRGGLCAVYRTVFGGDADYSKYIEMNREMSRLFDIEPLSDKALKNINGHILGEESNPPEFCYYVDNNSLYPYSGV
jgi:hypothetical protein